jgi:hypothetical protein
MKPRLSEKTPNYICADEERKDALYFVQINQENPERE